ncbi:hypothetical protein FRB96_000259 [Tulasnella sp. 330]|nr:hypothetical protein FRB96_000259 [Tulasnella sp. 330]KAG8886532.1 hypothetical protein FRB97_003043 [Tulasnella sp. 331]KAG8889789.1 hypothetical protein FRB98_002711 [Tulasnella sp. 332]
MSAGQEFLPGDVVSVNVPNEGQREGLVVGTSLDNVGRQIVEIRFDLPQPHYYRAWYPLVRRVRRQVGYQYYPQYVAKPVVERQIHYEY